MNATAPPGMALWSPLAHMPSVLDHRRVMVAGDGAYVTTREGRRLLDATAGLWHANVGHGRPEIAEAASRQMRRLETYHSFGFYSNDQALSLADRLAALVPVPDPRIIFTSGGSDSVEVTAKLARLHWQLEGEPDRTVVLSRADSYHGLHAYGSSLTGPDHYRDGYGPGTLVPDTARFSSTDADDLLRVLADVGAHRVAAIILEPVIGSGGIIAPPAGYLEAVQEAAARHGILLIADEVITGFGRTGHWFASQRFAFEPDMMTLAKGLTSGYAPLGAAVVSERIWRRFYDARDTAVYQHGLTYSGHATACAVAHANLDVLEADGLVARAAHLEKVLDQELQRLRNRPDIREIRTGGGFLAGVAPVDEISATAVADHAFEHGVLLRPLRDNLLQISPPFVVTEEEIATIVNVIEGALEHHAG
ncbi:aspartate aminotransferase family protein [Streptomyces sp. R39]|uniref:Aspartate aminotransferase family protein n=1 Tax=Streptomyces sp. R39 TaxID=3238631 RepID=A0AB39QY93_9ACTN